MYMEGKGVKASGKDALKWFQKAADEGNAMALTKMGNMYC
jgi:TPR repeat protein